MLRTDRRRWRGWCILSSVAIAAGALFLGCRRDDTVNTETSEFGDTEPSREPESSTPSGMPGGTGAGEPMPPGSGGTGLSGSGLSNNPAD
jgi:hypothetical protein